MKTPVIPVFFAIDDRFAPCLSVAIQSLVENASEAYLYHIVVLHQQLGEVHRRRLAALADGKTRIEFVEMRQRFEGISPHRMGDNLRPDCFTLTIYFRLFIADMFPEYDRGIYIDSDICVPGDISRLYCQPLGNCLIGACPDYSIFDIPPFVNYTQKAIGVDVHRYINSGVLLLNLKRLREVGLGSRFLELLNKWHFDSVAPDQDYLNALCKDQIRYLDEEWDAMPSDNRPALAHPSLVHYNRFAKPWIQEDVQYGDLFWRYARKSAYYADLLALKEGYSQEQREREPQRCGSIIAGRYAYNEQRQKTDQDILRE